MDMERWRNMVGIVVLVSLLAAADAALAGEGDTERAGDTLLVLVPATAYGTAFFLDDGEGEAEFCKSFFVNLAVTLALKTSIERERPDRSGNDSFPSMHASVTFQGAAFIHRRYGWRYALPAYGAAAFTGYSRVFARRHHAMDVAAGTVIGVLSGYFFATPAGGVVVTPVAARGFYGFTVGRTW